MASPSRDLSYRRASAALLALLGALYALGAFRASPGTEIAADDLRLVELWQTTGRLGSHPTDPSHLTKPGYVALLRTLLPSRGASPRENRRFLLVNAVLVIAGAGLLRRALSRLTAPLGALLFVLFLLLFLPLRDASDYVGSEAIASGLSMAALAAIVSSGFRSAGWLAAAAVPAGILIAIRPNESAALVGACLVGAIAAGQRASARALALGALTLVLVAGLVLAGLRAAGNRSGSFSRDAATILLWGTADYYWRFDVGPRPVASDDARTVRLQLDRAMERWRVFFSPWTLNRSRSLEWRLLHGLFSAEELPPRWTGPGYLGWDRTVRRWWWLAAVVLVALSVSIAAAARNEFRFVGLALVVACVAQAVTCGADPRLALPMLPLLAAVLAAALPSMRWTLPVAGVAAAVILLLTWRIAQTPDIAGCDFALVRGAGRRIEEALPPWRIPRAPRAVHFRLLSEPPFSRGLRVSIDGRPAFERPPGDPSPYPAFFTVPLTEAEAARAGRSGLRVSAETLGSADTGSFVYFPVSPPIFGLSCTVDGSTRLPSGFGGENSGGWPIWVTSD